MIDEKHTIKKALKIHYAENSLSGAQLKSLQGIHNVPGKLQKKSTKNRLQKYKWSVSIAASFLLFSVMFGYYQTPAVINSAYTDAVKDQSINNGIEPSMRQWMSEINIAAVPEEYPVEMSRFCQIDRYLTAHLRIAGTKQGQLHLFFHHGDGPVNWLNYAGNIKGMKWKLVNVRDDLTLIVMYTDDMREKSVQSILEKMLPELQA